MAKFLLVLVVAIVAAAIVFGVVTLISDGSAGLQPADPDGRAVPLPGARPLVERDVAAVRFDTAVRGYRMEQVDQALRRAAYDIGYKDELIGVLEAEVAALRAGRQDEADELARARQSAAAGPAVDLDAIPGTDVDDSDALAAEADESDTDSSTVPATATDAGATDDGGTDDPDEVPAGAFRAGADQQ